MPIMLEFDENGNVVGDTFQNPEDESPETKAESEEKSDFWDVIVATLRENAIYQGWKALQMGKGESFAAVSPTPDEYPIIDLGIEAPSVTDPDFNLSQTLNERQVPQEDKSYFEHVKNPEQFETTYDYYLQDKEDEKILNNASALSQLGAGILTFAVDPLVYIGVGAANRLGLAVKALRNPIAANALFGGIYGASSYSVKVAASNKEFSATDMSIDAVAAAATGVAFHGLGKGVSKLFKPVKEAIKASIMPKIDNMFLQEAGVLKRSSSPNVQKVKRFIWEIFNPTPMWQMYNSGNELLQKMVSKIYGFRTSNLAGSDAINGVSVTERVGLYNGDALKLSEEINTLREQYVKAGGTEAGFDSEVGLTLAEREIDSNTLVGKAAKKIVDFDNKYIQFEEGIKSKRYVVTKELANMPREEFEKKIRENNLKLTLQELVNELDRGLYNEDYGRLIESEETNIHKYLDELRFNFNVGKELVTKNDQFKQEKKQYAHQLKEIKSEILDAEKTIKKALRGIKRNTKNKDTLAQKLYLDISGYGSKNFKNTIKRVEQLDNLKKENKATLEEIQAAETTIKEKMKSMIELTEEKNTTKNVLSKLTKAQKNNVKELKNALRNSDKALGNYFSYLKTKADKNEKLVDKLLEAISQSSGMENSEVYKNLQEIISKIAKISSEIQHYEIDANKISDINKLREELSASIYNDSLPMRTFDTARHYLKRKYNPEAIDANMDKVGELLEREILLNNPQWIDNPKEVERVRNGIINSITGDRPSVSDHTPFEPKTFWASLAKEREVAISDEVLLENGIIQYDSVTNHINNLKFAVIDQELDKIAINEGYLGWRNRSGSKDNNSQYLINDFESKAHEAIGSERYKTRNADISQANKENYSYMLQLLTDTEMLLKGTYSKEGWATNWADNAFIRGVRDATTCAYSGFLWAAQIPDIAQIGMREGFAKPIKRLAPAIFKKDTLNKIDRDILYKFLDLLDTSAQATRFVDMGYTPESQRTWLFKPSKDDSRLTRYTRNVLTIGVEASNWMTTALKRNAAQGIYSDLIEACVKNNKEFLNKMGIDENQRQVIADLFYKYGDKTKNIKYFDPNLIEDVQLSDQIRASVETLTDEVIASPKAGNLPRMLRSSAGSTVFMFVSYPFMLFNNVYKPLFRGDISGNKLATAVAASLAFSTARKFIVDYLNGKETDWDAPETWKDIYTYSNLDTHISDGIEMLWRAATSGNPLATFSPAYQWFTNIVQVGHQLCRGKWGTRKQRNLLPPFNFGPFRPLTNPLLYENRGSGADW